MAEGEALTITFRCPPELKATLPPPIPAVEGVPDWFKAMPQRAFSEIMQGEQFTVKRCPPFIDAMTCGFLIPLATDVRVAGGMFTWDHDVPHGSSIVASHSPLDFHDNSQLTGSPLFEEDRLLIKFNCFWTIELPPGYSLLITHPVNRMDLPFVTLTGLVDADRYRDNFINFPARWSDSDFSGVVPKGTPVAQCVPIKRDDWTLSLDTIAGNAADRINDVRRMIANETDVYRRQFRARRR